MAGFLKVKNSAYETIKSYLLEEDEFLTPPDYFKLGSVKDVNHESKTIKISVHNSMPIGNCGDGVAVNNKAARILCELYGFESPGNL